MTLNTDQLAELLAGIARAQNAIAEAIDRSEPGWRSTHLVPELNIAANLRAGDPRLIDLPARILLRLQGRAGLDLNVIKADLDRLASGGTPAVAPAPPSTSEASGELDFSKA